MNFNSANPNISIGQLKTVRASVSRTDGKIYLFFGETPRAQVQIEISNPAKLTELDELKKVFPDAFISFQ